MSEWFQSLPPVEWFREQFQECPEGALDCDSISAQELFQFVLLAWLVAAAVLIVMDRFGGSLLGRSRPLAQEPPERARLWRWGRKTAPANYSLLPPGTTVAVAPPPELVMGQVARPELATIDLSDNAESHIDLDEIPATEYAYLYGASLEAKANLPDDAFWQTLASATAPVFGLENDELLRRGSAPERYNPITGRVESLLRDSDASELVWPWVPSSATIVGAELDEEEE